MKRSYSLALAIVLATLTAAKGEVTLQPKFQEGSEYKTKESIKTRQTLKLAGQNIDTAADTTILSQTKVGRNDEGDITLETTYTDVATEISLPGNKKVTYNSATGEAKSDDPNFAIILDQLKALKGATFTVVIDKNHQVKSVSGLKQEIGANADDIKVATQHSLDRFPKEAVQPGDTWEREIIAPLGQGQLFTLKRTYTYAGPEVRSTVTGTRKLEKVTAKTTDIQYSIKPNAGIPGTVTKSDLKAESSESILLFDAEKGQTVDAIDNMKVTGSITLSIMGQELPGELNLTMETRSRVAD